MRLPCRESGGLAMLMLCLSAIACRAPLTDVSQTEKGSSVSRGTGGQAAGSVRPALNRRALLVGVDNYLNVPKLRFCGADMRSLAKRLENSGFPKANILTLHDASAAAEVRPSKANIERELEAVLRSRVPGDLVLIAFSGHGQKIGPQSYLCPSDARWGEPATLISLDGIYQRMQDCPAGMKLMLVDACRNDPRPNSEKGATGPALEFATALAPPPGIVLLQSCSAGEISREAEEFGHGVFMHFVLQGLQGSADADRNGRVSLSELYGYAARSTQGYVKQAFDSKQTPSIRGDFSEFELADVGVPTSISPTQAGPTTPNQYVNAIGMKMVLIPAGQFIMGSPSSGESARANEKPAHLVKITDPFYLSACEVTRGQFRQFVSEAGYRTLAERERDRTSLLAEKPRTWLDPGIDQSDDHPVVCVTWEDAQAFCAWLSRRFARRHRLPTEAEWEYAARAGGGSDATPSPDDLDRSAWYFANTPDGRTHPVAQKAPNPWGLCDMLGNASEWCADWYGDDYYARSPQEDPFGPDRGDYRVARGGWFHAASAASCRPAVRFGHKPSACYNALGFRVAMNL